MNVNVTQLHNCIEATFLLSNFPYVHFPLCYFQNAALNAVSSLHPSFITVEKQQSKLGFMYTIGGN